MTEAFSIGSDDSEDREEESIPAISNDTEGYAWFLERIKDESLKEFLRKLRAFCLRFSGIQASCM